MSDKPFTFDDLRKGLERPKPYALTEKQKIEYQRELEWIKRCLNDTPFFENTISEIISVN